MLRLAALSISSAMALVGASQGVAQPIAPRFDTSLQWYEATDQAWQTFLTNCEKGMSDPNALIGIAYQEHQSGEWVSVAQTDDQAYITVSIKDGNVALLADFFVVEARVFLFCQVIGSWVGVVDPMNPGTLGMIEPSIVMDRVREHLGFAGVNAIGGGKLRPVLGQIEGTSFNQPDTPLGHADMVFKTESYSFDGLWSELGAVFGVSISSGHVAFQAWRTYKTNEQ